LVASTCVTAAWAGTATFCHAYDESSIECEVTSNYWLAWTQRNLLVPLTSKHKAVPIGA